MATAQQVSESLWVSNGPAASATFPSGQPGPGVLHLDKANSRLEFNIGGTWKRVDFSATHTQTFSAHVAAADTDVELQTNIIVAPFAGTVTAVTYVTEDDITGADTNSRTVTLVNKGSDGTGTAAVATLAFVDTVDAGADEATTITVTTDAEDKVVAAGDVLQWSSTAPGDGLADPGGLVVVTIQRS